VLEVEHDARYVKTNDGRTYMSVRLDNNVVRWSEPFLSRIAGLGPKAPCAGLTVGHPPSHDPGELVVRARENRLEATARGQFVPSLVIHAADYNSQRIVGSRFQLPSGGSAAPSERRAANKRAATGPR
jgi:hypothetical protein